MRVLYRDCLEKTYRGKVSRGNSGKEILNVIVMVGSIALVTDGLN
jgi:hypothetical protein